MNTWTSSIRATAVLALAGLAACGEVSLPPLGQSLGLRSAPVEEGGAEPLRQARMARGAVTLAMPQGYCLDPESVTSRFALAARCDTLGVDGFFAQWDLALVTVSLTRFDGEEVNAAAAEAGGEILWEETRDGVAFARMRGDAPLDGVNDVHWRAATVINGQLLGLALYAPDGSAVLETDGARLLADIVAATRRAGEDVGG